MSVSPDGHLRIFTIYSHPLDLPDAEYVVRGFTITAAGPLPEAEVLIAQTLDEARGLIPWEADTCILPGPDDPPAIVESWL